MKFVFIGGPGRSGTSVFAHRLQIWPEIGSFVDNELKIYSEADGIWDLYWNFVEAYSPQRAPRALDRFRQRILDISVSYPGYVGLRDLVGEAELNELIEQTLAQLSTLDGTPCQVSPEAFLQLFADMTRQLAGLLTYPDEIAPEDRIFIEKTPHNLLRTDLIARLPLDSLFIHVMRDPRLIAASLERMPWGPGNLLQCCDWVEQYIIAMKSKFAWARDNGIVIHSMFIEGVATQKRQHVQYLQTHLGVSGEDTIFDTLTPATLSESAETMSSESRSLLDARLGETAEALGYSANVLGLRQPEPSARFETHNGLSSVGWMWELPMSRLAGKSDPDSPTQTFMM